MDVVYKPSDNQSAQEILDAMQALANDLSLPVYADIAGINLMIKPKSDK